MAIKYHYFITPGQGDEPEENSKLHPRVVSARKVTLTEICERLSQGSSINPGVAEGILKTFSKAVIKVLSEGNYIHWDGFGTFSVSLEADPVTDPAQMTPSRVRVKRLNFRPFKNVKQELDSIEMIRSDRNPKLPYMTAEERQENILGYLQKNETIQSHTCTRINGCSRTTAGRDLKNLVKQGLIREIKYYGGYVYTLQ